MRYEAINALRDQALPDHHDAFVDALTDTDQYIRQSAAGALRELQDARYTERFRDMLANHPHSEMRYEAINALRDQGSPDHHDAFVDALTDTDQYVREAATEALTDQAP